jgi:hypothetical protein
MTTAADKLKKKIAQQKKSMARKKAISAATRGPEVFGRGRRTKTGKNTNLKKEDRVKGGRTRQSMVGSGSRIKPALGTGGASRGKIVRSLSKSKRQSI